VNIKEGIMKSFLTYKGKKYEVSNEKEKQELEIFIRSFDAYKDKRWEDLSENDKKLWSENWQKEIKRYGRLKALIYALRASNANKLGFITELNNTQLKSIEDIALNFYGIKEEELC
jgi:hypothetical protein